jgi:hypothetical protein
VNIEGSPPTPTTRVRDVRAEAERLGTTLAEVLGVLIRELSSRALGPQELSAILGTTSATAGKLLRALSRTNPVAVLKSLPGPVPLRGLVEQAGERGAKESTTGPALESIAAYSELVRHAGDIKSFEAMLTAWLPEERNVFETARRQSVFRALSEIDGASCRLKMNTIVLAPGANPQEIDLVGVTGLFGVHRLRPDAQVELATYSFSVRTGDKLGETRQPTTLDGVPLNEAPIESSLDEFCLAPPAPLVPEQFGEYVQYTMGPTDIGANAEFDMLMAELNHAAGRLRTVELGWISPFFTVLPQVPARTMVFDVILHLTIYAECSAELRSYTPGSRGLANPHDPTREMDRRECHYPVTEIDYGLSDLRLVEYPKYSALVRHVLEKLGRERDEFRAFRVQLQFPLPMHQLTMVLRGPAD